MPGGKGNIKPEDGIKTRFKKGQSGNPAGGPKKLPSLDVLLADVLGEDPNDPAKISEAKEVLVAMLKQAKKGNVQAQVAILDRAYGKPKQAVEHTGPDGDPLHTGGITLVFNTANIEPVTSEAAMAEIFEKFKDG